MAADIDPTNPGCEMWSSDSHGIRTMTGDVLHKAKDADDLQHDNSLVLNGRWLSMNFGIWWDGDLLREMLDHETVSKYVPQQHSCKPLMQMFGCQFNNGTKSNPCLQGDIIGDWREEILVRTKDNEHLRLYISPMPTPYRFHTFLQDPVYRHCITTQNVSYNQPTQVGFYFGAELKGSGKLFRGWQF
jgi:rhamnogalacturonan endolyase